jgi:hypothetical protein
MDDSGAIGVLAALALVVVGGLVVTGAVLYATDFAIDAEVHDKRCGAAINVISVETRLFGIDHDVQGVPQHECGLIEVGDQVEYHIRTGHTTVYRDGGCFYDSINGPCAGNPLAYL